MYEIKEKTTEKAVIYCNATKSTYKLKCIRTDANYGNFYMFNSVLEMPTLRYTAYELVKEFNKLGFDAEDLKKDHENIKKIVLEAENYKSALHEIYNIIAQQEAKIKNYWNHKNSLLMITALLIIPEAQLTEIGDFNQSIAEGNIKQWSKDTEMINFFLDLAIQNMQSSTQKLDRLSRINSGTTAV